ncbi:tyrosine-type recombinase/integrase [Aestuariicoccus sp. MJ-SS9]|uniref:tyrosine-type recombinase/integrase n=1 Tax=Aestuariicoccus sp. MJ-SS9 TaxID=3079855 RepID=UPI00290ABEE1|nr:tyrosine-type recombinase/integrase [Aestuariicoccus sp. MJ-SS9]MDU8913507.1 tyrosine-type recombinase/integrase [Aestuariicoccus sp. MJ-SS9]
MIQFGPHHRTDWRSEFQRLEGAYAPSTMRSYRSDVEAFENWCQENGLAAPFPAAVETVCRFLEDQGRSKAPSTVRRRLYAIRKVHRLLDLPDPTYAEDINLAFRRVRRAKPVRPKQARGMTAVDLKRFLEVQPDTPWGLRNMAMLSLGYELMTRRSELVALRDEDVEFREDGTLRVLIRRSKADQEGRGRIGYSSVASAHRLHAWQRWKGETTHWLFCPIYKEHPIDRPLSDTTVKVIIKQAAKMTGYGPEDVRSFSGHSMRIGAAQELLRCGFDMAAIMRAGGWKSINVLARYLEHAEHNVWA